MMFYLGTHIPSWLWLHDVPLFVSRRRLAKARVAGPALAPWALDSGGYSELSLFGSWTVSPIQYVREVHDWAGRLGNLQWAAIQDWMVEPWILAKTGLTIRAHQKLTVRSYLTLQRLASDLPWTPVLQGWSQLDYLVCYLLYAVSGVLLPRLPVVGVGSVCRRQGTPAVRDILRTLHRLTPNLHGFGVKADGLRLAQAYLRSADSMAWSFNARRLQRPAYPTCVGHKNCANCPRYALDWRSRIVASLA